MILVTLSSLSSLSKFLPLCLPPFAPSSASPNFPSPWDYVPWSGTLTHPPQPGYCPWLLSPPSIWFWDSRLLIYNTDHLTNWMADIKTQDIPDHAAQGRKGSVRSTSKARLCHCVILRKAQPLCAFLFSFGNKIFYLTQHRVKHTRCLMSVSCYHCLCH